MFGFKNNPWRKRKENNEWTKKLKKAESNKERDERRARRAFKRDEFNANRVSLRLCNKGNFGSKYMFIDD